jgi:hypothetical protein
MPSPFPGMNPYLERSSLWPSFHFRLIGAIAAALEPQLSARYYIEVETRSYQSSDLDEETDHVLIGIPDAAVIAKGGREADLSANTALATQTRPQQVTLPVPQPVKERYLEVRELGTDQVITAIEVLSPKNKRSGPGRFAYETKRQHVLASATHLVEIDLLRGGKAMPMTGLQATTPYRILVSRSDQRPAADLYGVSLQEPLPTVPVPLKQQENELELNLQTVLNQVYAQARYALRIDYSQPPPPPALAAPDQAWVDEILRAERSI